MSDAQEALAALTGSVAAEAVANGSLPVEAVVQPVAQPVAASEVAPVAAAPAAVAAPDPVAEATVIDFTPKLSDDLQALLDEPDFEEEAELELQDDDSEYEYLDADVAKRLKAAEKRAQFLEGQLAKSNQKKWVDENLRSYPRLRENPVLAAELKGISATSRRAFAREAARLNAKYESILGPAEKAMAEARAAVATGAVEVARQEVAQAWGTPASDTLPAADVARQQALEKARATGGLKAALKVLMQ